MTKIKLTESKLKWLIKESVKEFINEAQNQWWRGVPDVTMIWHGEWADPELQYEDYVANYYDVEDPLWGDFKEETGCDDNTENVDDIFNDWLVKNKYDVWEYITEVGEQISDEDNEEYD